MNVRPTPGTNELLDRIRGGDRGAAELFAQHRPRLQRLVQTHLDERIASRVDASDVVQDALLVACRRLPEFLRGSSLPFYAWLRQIAWDRLIDTHRRHVQADKRSVKHELPLDVLIGQRTLLYVSLSRLTVLPSSNESGEVGSAWKADVRTRAVQLSASAVELAKHLANPTTRPDGHAVRKEQTAKVTALLLELPDADREILVLKHLEVLDNSKCAVVLGISIAAVKKRYLRALVRVRMLMQKEVS